MDETSLEPCSNCGLRPAVVHSTTIHFGSKKTVCLCEICHEASGRLANSFHAEFFEALKNATCRYCGEKAVAGGTNPLRWLGEEEEYRFMCMTCSTEFNRVLSERLGFVSSSLEPMSVEQQVAETEKSIETIGLQVLIGEIDLHMKQWLGQRFN